MENEENRGLINKKASKNQLESSWLRLGQFSVGSLSHTLGDLKFYWITFGGCGMLGFLEKEGEGRETKSKRALGSTITSNLLVGTELHVCFLC